MQTSEVAFKVPHSLVACGIHRFEKLEVRMGLHCRSAGQPITLKALTSAWSISATALLAICWDWGSLRVGRSISLLIALKGTSAFQDHLIVLLLGVKKVRNGTTDAYFRHGWSNDDGAYHNIQVYCRVKSQISNGSRVDTTRHTFDLIDDL